MWGPLVTSRLRHQALASADKCPDSRASLQDKMPYLVLSWAVGLVTFPSCLGLIQVCVFRPLRLTCAVWGSSLFGLCSVGVSSLIASTLTMTCAMHVFQINNDLLYGSPGTCSSKAAFPETVLLYAVCSSVAFLCLGGRFRSVLPSSLIHPGAFAKLGLSATLSYATTRKKQSLKLLGRKHGCHTCGRRWFVKDFIADHQPPLAVRTHKQ